MKNELRAIMQKPNEGEDEKEQRIGTIGTWKEDIIRTKEELAEEKERGDKGTRTGQGKR